MSQPLEFEIVIPTYNRLCYLRLALKSALEQNYGNFRVTVVDSASSDGTLEFLKEVKSERLRIVRFEDNLGISGNWSRALNVADAQLVSIFHDDDIMLPNFVAKQIEMFASHPDMVLSHTAGEVISGKNEVMFLRTLDWPSVTDGREFVTRLLTEDALVPIPPSVVLNRRFLPQTFEFETDFPAMLDLVAWIKVARYGKIGYVNVPLVQYRVHDSQTTNSILARYPEKIQQREKFFEVMKFELIDICGYTFARASKEASRYFSRAISKDLLHICISESSIYYKAKLVFFCGTKHPKLWCSPQFIATTICALTLPRGVLRVAKKIKNWSEERNYL